MRDEATREIRDLERRYREERAQILGDETRSWEAKMRAIKDLFERYCKLRDGAEEEGAKGA